MAVGNQFLVSLGGAAVTGLSPEVAQTFLRAVAGGLAVLNELISGVIIEFAERAQTQAQSTAVKVVYAAAAAEGSLRHSARL